MRTAIMALLAAIGMASGAAAAESSLTETITAQDKRVFDAYNACDLDTFAAAFTPDVEFYHDEGGVTWDRQSVVGSTRKYICGKVRRELIPGSLRVYPIKDYGAIEEGEHRFCQKDEGCAGVAKFVMVWKREGESWVLTRVLSYGHRPARPEER
jgi:hypothetical protein